MPVLEFACEIDAPLAEVWKFHDTIETLFRLTPPHTQVKLEGELEPMRVGVVYPLRMKRWGIVPLSWDARITRYDPPHGFADEQIPGKGPFAAWTHEHQFKALSPTRTLLIDRITYTPPFGILGKIADAVFIRRDLEAMFAYRHKVTKEALS
jgi:uncharacterized protein